MDSSKGANLLRALKDWRKRIADELQRPIYQVMSNQLLEDIARFRPRTVDQLSALNGVGPFTRRQYGKRVIGVVLEHVGDEDENIERIHGVDTEAFWDTIRAQKKTKKVSKAAAKTEEEKEEKKKALMVKKAKRKQLQVMTEEAIASLEAESTIDIEELNDEQQKAAAHILEGHNVFVTGSAGTGKVKPLPDSSSFYFFGD